MTATKQPATASANQELFMVRGGIQQCNRNLRAAKRLIASPDSAPGMESLHDAIDALSLAVEALARIVEEGQR